MKGNEEVSEDASEVRKSFAQFLGLRYHEDLRTLMFCCLYFFLVFFQLKYDFEYRLVNWSLFWSTAFVAFQGAVSVHNAVHCPPFKQAWQNKLFHATLSVWFGHCASSYVPGHNLSHHRNLQTNKDVMRTTKMRFKWNFLNGLFFMPTILLSTSANDANYFNAQKALGRPIYYQLRFEAMVYVFFQVAVAAYNPHKWLFVVWIPCLLGKYGIISLNMLQHDGCDPNSKYNHSRNFVGDSLNYFCFNNGFHGIHHMYPGKHWSQLKAEHEKRVKPFINPALDEPSILQYMWRTFIYPGIRLDFKGNLVPIVDSGPDEPWFYGTVENYSDREVDKSVWTKGLSQYEEPLLAKRSARSYTTM